MRLRAVKPRLILVVASLLAAAALAAGAQGVPTSSAAYTAQINNSTTAAVTAANFTCAGAMNVAAERNGAIFVYALNETSGTSAADQSGHSATGVYRGAFATTTAGPLACPRDTAGAYVLNGSSSYVQSPTILINPTTFSAEVWFKTSVSSGKLIGFGNGNPLAVSTSGNYDRHIYLSPTGQLVFGTYNGATNTIASAAGYANGQWHHVVATMTPTAGMALYVDGALVASNANFKTPEFTTGYWRVGYDNLNAWPNMGTNPYFTGQMRFAAAYSIALTPTQVQLHYLAGR